MSELKNGIDVSHFQNVIDWSKVIHNPNKIDFVFIKASNGVGMKDPQLDYNAKWSKTVGLKIGYYHFATLNSLNVVADATAEANYFLSLVKACPVPDMPLVLDIEATVPGVSLTKDQVLLYINTFFNIIKTAGYPYALYSYTPFLNSNLPLNHGLSSIPLWIAAYSHALTPVLPHGWDKYWIWQYNDCGACLGINGKVDLNKMA